MDLLGAVPHGSDTVLLPRFNAGATAPASAKTILLAEDDTDLRETTTSVLNIMGYRVIACTDGRAAFNSFFATPAIDLLLTDYEMPGLSGLQLAQDLSARQSALPVLFVSLGAG